MIETKSMSVAPENEQKTINALANFGWTLQSSQEINVKDSHLEEKDDKLYSVTESEHYVKLVFQRDTAMANYDEITDLEAQYNAVPAPVYEHSNTLRTLGFILGGLGILFCIGEEAVLGVISIILGVGAFIWGYVRNSKRDDVYSDEMKEYNDKLGEIEKKSRALLK